MWPLKSLCVLAFLCAVLYCSIVLLQLKLDLSISYVSHLPYKTSNTSSATSQLFKVNQTILKEVCKQKHQYLQQEVFRKTFENWILILPKNKIAYCHLAKVGSSAWKTYLIPLVSSQEMQEKLLQMDNFNRHIAINKLFSSKNVKTSHQKLSKYLSKEKYFTFVFVRHPLDRIVSAYVDKVLSTKAKDYAYVRKGLVQKYGQVTFQNFLRFVLKSLDKCNSQTTSCFQSIDGHWQPYYQRCEFCNVKYDYIGRLETFNHDVQEVLIQANLTEYIPLQNIKQIHRSTTMSKSQFEVDEDGIQAKELTKQYFKNVEESIVKKIIQYYELDFLLFQYSARDILK